MHSTTYICSKLWNRHLSLAFVINIHFVEQFKEVALKKCYINTHIL